MRNYHFKDVRTLNAATDEAKAVMSVIQRYRFRLSDGLFSYNCQSIFVFLILRGNFLLFELFLLLFQRSSIILI